MKRKFEASIIGDEKKNIGHTDTITGFNASYSRDDNNWMDTCYLLCHLKERYPAYFMADSVNPDFLKIKTKIVANTTPVLEVDHSIRQHQIRLLKNEARDAEELFRSLFRIPYKSLHTIETNDLTKIVKYFGSGIIAHGVEEAKGGMRNLLLMCISDKVRAPNLFWGYFVYGLPDISPLSHGPYYLIYQMPSNINIYKFPHNPALTEVARILVPFDENKKMLIEKLDEMIEKDLITDKRKNVFVEKLVTYSEFYVQLQAQVTTKKEVPPVNCLSFFPPEEISFSSAYVGIENAQHFLAVTHSLTTP